MPKVKSSSRNAIHNIASLSLHHCLLFLLAIVVVVFLLFYSKTIQGML